jgi:serine/threonine protein phosphatase PrpC
MVQFIERTTEWKEYLSGGCRNIELLGEGLRKAFLSIDDALRAHQINGPDASGCTSVTAMITPQFIVCANAGDSRCILGTNGGVKAMSEDHKPFDDGERRRIEEAGGSVQWKRVDGDLAVSRALGDFQYKCRNDLGPKQQKVQRISSSPSKSHSTTGKCRIRGYFHVIL